MRNMASIIYIPDINVALTPSDQVVCTEKIIIWWLNQNVRDWMETTTHLKYIACYFPMLNLVKKFWDIDVTLSSTGVKSHYLLLLPKIMVKHRIFENLL